MNQLVIVLIALAQSALAAPHTVELRVSDGRAVFAHTIKTSEGKQWNFVGPVRGLGSAAQREMIFNGTLTPRPGTAGGFQLEYQTEISGGQYSPSPSIQSQGTLEIRPGVSVMAVECGPWMAELALDGRGTLGKKKKKPEPLWDSGGLGNYRLTAEAVNGRNRHRCSQVLLPGNQCNVIEKFAGGSKKSFILNSMLNPSQGASRFDLRYQMEYSPVGSAAFQHQNQEILALGSKSVNQSGGSRLVLLLEGKPRREQPAAAAQDQRGDRAVPLLR